MYLCIYIYIYTPGRAVPRAMRTRRASPLRRPAHRGIVDNIIRRLSTITTIITSITSKVTPARRLSIKSKVAPPRTNRLVPSRSSQVSFVSDALGRSDFARPPKHFVRNALRDSFLTLSARCEQLTRNRILSRRVSSTPGRSF